MRKILSLLTIFLLTVGLAACGSGEQAKENSEAKPATAKKVEEKTKETNEQQSVAEEKQADSTEPTEQQTEQVAQAGTETSTNSENQASSTAKAAATTSDATKKSVNTNTTKAATSNNTTTTTAPSTPTTPTPSTPAPETQKPAMTVTFSIVGPDNHVILSPTKVNFSDGDTVFDVLKQLDKQHSFVVVSRGSGATTYIEGIEGSDFSYYEFDEGPTSGWVLKQNGASLTKSVGVTVVKDGDRIECIYTK